MQPLDEGADGGGSGYLGTATHAGRLLAWGSQALTLLPYALGIALPMGEAHRHEPPVPHDEVVVDMGREREDSAENKQVLGGDEGNAPKAAPREPAELHPQKEAQGKEVMAENHAWGGTEKPVKNLKNAPEVSVPKDGRPPYKEQEPGRAAPDAKARTAVLAGERNAEAAGDGEKMKLQFPGKAEEVVKSLEKEAEPGEKPELPLPEHVEPAEPQQLEQRESRNGEDRQAENAENKLEGECGTWAASAGFLCRRNVPALPGLALLST